MKALVVSGRLEFPDRIKQIGVYALQHPHQMAFMTIQEIAQATETSPSSVGRFAKTFGFAGYTALRRVFQKHIAEVARQVCHDSLNIDVKGTASIRLRS
nr:hypothetical protein [Sinorhizobium meliloti]